MSDGTQEPIFRSEYEQELETWLRRRFAIYCIANLAYACLQLPGVIRIVFGIGSEARDQISMALVAGFCLHIVIVLYYLLWLRPQLVTRQQVLNALTVMIMLIGAGMLLLSIYQDHLRGKFSGDILGTFFLLHFFACLLLPWKPRESLRPMIPLMGGWCVYLLAMQARHDPWPTVFAVVFSPGVLLPGLGLCAWRLRRHSRWFRSRMMGKHFLSMRREFSQARGVHESMFPAPYDDGHVKFEYTFAPMRELGGDFVHLHVGVEGVIHVVLLDVTGHGLPAAMTVNRLYGEIERIRAENRSVEPGDVMRLLNRYVALTLVRHNIYATAMCLMLDPYRGELRWANAGHPPAFLRGANGVVTSLGATAAVLGAVDDEFFEVEQQTMELSPGDVLIVYTDGAFEARNSAGHRFGLANLRGLMQLTPPPRNWPQFIASVVNKHNGGRSEDDVLVAAVSFVSYRRDPSVARNRAANDEPAHYE